VDLDPEQQLVSEIWGLEIRLCDPQGRTLFKGQFKPAAFADIWDRCPSANQDGVAGAMYQSVLTDLDWPGEAWKDFAFLYALREACGCESIYNEFASRMSIKFNLDGYDMNVRSPRFTRGRIIGTIGSASLEEPCHLVLGRHLMPTATDNGGFFRPTGRINSCCARLDMCGNSRRLYLDLGNAIPCATMGGPPSDLGPLTLTALRFPDPPLSLGKVPYLEENWYANTAGVFETELSEENFEIVKDHPLALCLSKTDGTLTIAIREPAEGLYLRADQFVFRLSPDQTDCVTLFAAKWGRPYTGARILSIRDPSQLQPFSDNGTAPPVGTPAQALCFDTELFTDSNGRAILRLHGKDPGKPRAHIDGQVYGVRPFLGETILPSVAYPFNQCDLISVLLWEKFEPKLPLNWHSTIRPIFQQYASLYPVMRRLMDLGDYESVCRNRELLLFVFGLPDKDPNFMPVTRDLSPAKRRFIIKWLSVAAPLEGSPPLGRQEPLAVRDPRVATAIGVPQLEGKAAAAARRLTFRNLTAQKDWYP
jgi:hypothetical protein